MSTDQSDTATADAVDAATEEALAEQAARFLAPYFFDEPIPEEGVPIMDADTLQRFLAHAVQHLLDDRAPYVIERAKTENRYRLAKADGDYIEHLDEHDAWPMVLVSEDSEGRLDIQLTNLEALDLRGSRLPGDAISVRGAIFNVQRKMRLERPDYYDVQGVFAGEGAPAFAYTVGLYKNFGEHPELITMSACYGPNALGGLLNDLGRQIREGRRFDAPGLHEHVFHTKGGEEGKPSLSIKLVPVEDQHRGHTVTHVDGYYRDAGHEGLIPVLQVIIPDEENRFPGDEGYEHPMGDQDLGRITGPDADPDNDKEDNA